MLGEAPNLRVFSVFSAHLSKFRDRRCPQTVLGDYSFVNTRALSVRGVNEFLFCFPFLVRKLDQIEEENCKSCSCRAFVRCGNVTGKVMSQER
jgi:hypothetical protein